MNQALALISRSSTRIDLPDFKVGQTVRIHQKIKEGEKTRLQAFEGIIIKARQGSGINATITVRKIVDGVGVERVFPIHSPLIAKVEITREARVRRSKLYFLRDRSGKSARMKTTMLEGQVYEPKAYVEDVPAVAEEVAAPIVEEAAPIVDEVAPVVEEVAPVVEEAK